MPTPRICSLGSWMERSGAACIHLDPERRSPRPPRSSASAPPRETRCEMNGRTAAGSALDQIPEHPPTPRHADCTCFQANARRRAVGRVSRLRRFPIWERERCRRPKCRPIGNLEHAWRIGMVMSPSRSCVSPHLSTCFQPGWAPGASFVLHTIQRLAPQPFDRALARKHEQG